MIYAVKTSVSEYHKNGKSLAYYVVALSVCNAEV